MVFRNYSAVLALPMALLLTSMLGCSGGDGRMMRNGSDLLVMGSSGNLYDSVPGDVILTGGQVTFSGTAGGDYLGAGGNQTVGGHVAGSIRAAGGEVHVIGTTDKNATIAGGKVSVDSPAVIGGNVYLAAGDVDVHGNVRGSLLATGGTVVLNGPVGRDVEVSAGSLRLGPGAQISGNLRYRVPKDKVTIDRAAHVSGTITAVPVSKGPRIRDFLWPLGILLAGVVMVALFPGYTSDAAELLPHRPVASALVGVGWVVLVPLAIIAAGVTIIGLPLAIVSAGLYVCVFLLSDVPFAIWLGRLLLRGRARDGRRGVLLQFLTGGLVLLVIALIPLIGPIVLLISGVLGLGAILLEAKAWRERATVAPSL